MDPIYLIFAIVAAVIVGLLALVYSQVKKLNVNSGVNDLSKLVLEQIGQNRTEINEQLGQNREEINKQLEAATKTTGENLIELNKRLENIKQTRETMSELGDQVGSLSKILGSSHRRGRWGERQLEDILSSYLHKGMYERQYTVTVDREKQSTVRFDCFLKLEDPPGSIGIDAKNYTELFEGVLDAKSPEEEDVAGKELEKAVIRDLKDISNKYIIPGITADLALCFIPSEAIMSYLDDGNHENIFKVSEETKVHLCSPHSLIPALHAVRAVSERTDIVKQADLIVEGVKKIRDNASRLLDRTEKTEKTFNTLLKHIHDVTVSAKKIKNDSDSLSKQNQLDSNGEKPENLLGKD